MGEWWIQYRAGPRASQALTVSTMEVVCWKYGNYWVFSHTDSYTYMEDLLQLDACRPLSPMHLPERMREVTTPLRCQEWDRCLASHPDLFRQYIVDGIRFGF